MFPLMLIAWFGFENPPFCPSPCVPPPPELVPPRLSAVPRACDHVYETVVCQLCE